MTTDKIIYDIVSERVEPAEPQVEDVTPTEEAIEEAEATEPEASEEAAEDNTEVENSDDPEKEYVEFPKTAKNALHRKNKQIKKLKAQLKQFEQAQASQDEPEQVAPPNQDDYEEYGEFIKDNAIHEVRQELEAKKRGEDKARAQQEHAQFLEQKHAQIQESNAKYAKEIPDFEDVMVENSEYVEFLPKHVQDILYAAEDTSMAFYNIAKSGELANLAAATPHQAAVMVAQAQNAKAAPAKTPQQAPIKTAPAPLSANKGTGKSGRKTLQKMSGSELLNWVNS